MQTRALKTQQPRRHRDMTLGRAYLERSGVGPSRCNQPPVMLIFRGSPGEPLLPNDGGFLAVINAIREPLRIFWEEGDECILSTHSQLFLWRQYVPADFVCFFLSRSCGRLSRQEASLHTKRANPWKLVLDCQPNQNTVKCLFDMLHIVPAGFLPDIMSCIQGEPIPGTYV